VRIEVALKDVGARENGAKHKLPENISLHGQGLLYETNICELEDHDGAKGWSSN